MSPPDEEVRAALEANLPPGRQLARLARRPCAHASSFLLEELEATLDDGTVLRLVFKTLSLSGLSAEGRAARPEFLIDPHREIEAYRTLLAAEPGTAAFAGAVCDPTADRFWLFLEHVRGAELYKVGEFGTWLEVARWLGGFHARHAREADDPEAHPFLVRYDAEFHRRWLPRARAAVDRRGASQHVAARFERLAAGHGRLVARLNALPVTVVHGDFYPANVLIRAAGPNRVCPIDWELAGVGPGLWDLAALVAGNWTDVERGELAAAYADAVRAGGGRPPAPCDLLPSLDACRLQVAIQRLGWATGWSPPAAHRHDWLGEALGLVDRLGL